MKIKNLLRLALIVALIRGSCNLVLAQSPAHLKKTITYPASDSLHGRISGTDDERKAAEYIIETFKAEGIYNAYSNFTNKDYLQHFTYNPIVDSVKTQVSSNNVIAVINNHAENTIVIGAHYGQLGMGDPKHSLYVGPPTAHHGADNNARGVAAMLELASQLKSSNYKNNNYIFVAFGGEGLGLYGSKSFVQHSPVQLDKIDYMINLDMVGRADSVTKTLTVNGIGTSPVFKDALAKIQTPLHIKTTESGLGPSDQTSFYLKDIPVIFLFSGQHKDYHKPSDTGDKINYSVMADVINYTMALIGELNSKGRIGFTKTKDDNVDRRLNLK